MGYSVLDLPNYKKISNLLTSRQFFLEYKITSKVKIDGQ